MKKHVFTKPVSAMGMQGEADVFVHAAPGQVALTVAFKGKLMNVAQNFHLEAFEAVALLDALAGGIEAAGFNVRDRHYQFNQNEPCLSVER